MTDKSIKYEAPCFGNAKELLRRRRESLWAEKSDTATHTPLERATVVVAGGYGVGSRENFALLYRLAELLGGEVGATRAAVDAGFCEPALMIGITGKEVHPELYIAVGISGHLQHLAAVRDVKHIISINRDAEAPINRVAEQVIVGDAREELLRLIDSITNHNTPTDSLYEQFLRR